MASLLVIISLLSVRVYGEALEVYSLDDSVPEIEYSIIGDETQIDIGRTEDVLLGESIIPSEEVNRSGEGIPIDKKHFPDKNFRRYVLDEFDIDGDNKLSKSEIAQVDHIWLSNWDDGDDGYHTVDIKSLVGIEYFYNLEELDCVKLKLKKLDVSKNSKLKVLYCSQNMLKKLDVSKNIKLKELYCESNQLTKLDVRNNANLEYISCEHNKLKSLKLGTHKNLWRIYMWDNAITSVDIGGCKKILKNKNYTLSNHLVFDQGKTEITNGKKVLCAYMPDYNYVSYNKLARRPNTYKGKKIYFDGEIVQVIEKGKNITFRIATDDNGSDVIWCTYTRPMNYSRFLNNDSVRIYGISTGLYTYTSIFGEAITIPSCKVDRIEFECMQME